MQQESAPSPRAENEEERRAVVAQVYREHNTALIKYLNAKLSSPLDAQDVAHEAFVRMLRLDEPETISHLQAFLFKIAKNIAIDRLRSRSRSLEIQTDQEKINRHACSNPGQDVVFEARQELNYVRKIIAKLPPKCRKAFMLYKFEGVSYREIAKEMRLSESMVRKYVLRGVAFCSDHIKR